MVFNSRKIMDCREPSSLTFWIWGVMFDALSCFFLLLILSSSGWLGKFLHLVIADPEQLYREVLPKVLCSDRYQQFTWSLSRVTQEVAQIRGLSRNVLQTYSFRKVEVIKLEKEVARIIG